MPEFLHTLPVLGLGVSLSLDANPDPVWLAQQAGGPAFIEYAGQVDVARILPAITRVRNAGLPVLFHPSFINFCGSFANAPHWLQAAAEHIRQVQSPWFAQDCAYCFRDDGYGYASQYGYFVPPLFNRASLEKAISRVQEVQAQIPVPLAIEPPPLTFVVGNIPLLAFFGELAEACDCAILLDMGHLVSWQMASGKDVLADTQHFPWQRVIEVHIAGGKLKQGEQGPVYIDAHEEAILDETWQMLERLLPLLPNVKALCYECEGVEGQRVIETLALLRNKVAASSASAALVASIGGAV